MRIIKFRAWDPKNKKMIYLGDGEISYFMVNNPSYKLMQYIDFKVDKNGKELYENDLLMRYDALYQIKWEDYKSRFILWLLDSYSNPNSEAIIELTQLDLSLFELIGNIYENLEEKEKITLNNKKIGKFRISAKLIRKDPNIIAEAFSIIKFVPLRIEMIFYSDEIEYIGLSNRFEEVNEEAKPYKYDILIIGQDNDLITGTKMTIFSREDRAIVEGEPGLGSRVQRITGAG